jgi:hypothetical protein
MPCRFRVPFLQPTTSKIMMVSVVDDTTPKSHPRPSRTLGPFASMKPPISVFKRELGQLPCEIGLNRGAFLTPTIPSALPQPGSLSAAPPNLHSIAPCWLPAKKEPPEWNQWPDNSRWSYQSAAWPTRGALGSELSSRSWNRRPVFDAAGPSRVGTSPFSR